MIECSQSTIYSGFLPWLFQLSPRSEHIRIRNHGLIGGDLKFNALSEAKGTGKMDGFSKVRSCYCKFSLGLGRGKSKQKIHSWDLTYSFPKALFKMIFLFPRWDILVPWRVRKSGGFFLKPQVWQWLNSWRSWGVATRSHRRRTRFEWENLGCLGLYDLQGGPLAVINGVMGPLEMAKNKVVTGVKTPTWMSQGVSKWLVNGL